MIKRDAMPKKSKWGSKEKPRIERTDAVSGHGQNCQCMRHRAQRMTDGKQQ